MTTQTKAQLQDFLAKLERAKKAYCQQPHITPTYALEDVGLVWGKSFRLDFRRCSRYWFVNASAQDRIAMWDNSIAYCKQLIEEAKE